MSLAYFLVLLATWPSCFILGSFSSLRSFIFIQIFSNWDFFFFTFHSLFRVSIYCTPCTESLNYVLCLTCWKEHTFEGFFSLWFAYCFPPCEKTFHLFSCLVEFRFPVDYYKRKMDQVISNVKEF